MASPEEGPAPTGPPQAIVFFGERMIELAEISGPTLQELCDAFGLPFAVGTCIQDRLTGRVVATLPFETLPPLPAATKATPDEQFRPRGEDTDRATDEQAADDTDNADSLPDPVLFDLIVPSSEGHDVDDSDEEVDPLEGVPEVLGEAAKRLVKLGAVGLLSEETEARVEADPYVAEDAPGLLKRIMYGDEVYCPYRVSRDPLHTSRAVASKVTNAHAREHLYGNGKPYWATLDSYRIPHVAAPSSGGDAVVNPLFFGRPLTNEQQAQLFSTR